MTVWGSGSDAHVEMKAHERMCGMKPEHSLIHWADL